MINCETCGKEFEPRSWEKNRSFCSNACSGKARQKRTVLVCENCGKEKAMLPSKAKGRRFCSHECYADSHNHISVFSVESPETKNHSLDEKTIKRFWAKVKRAEAEQCWEWMASKNNKGYGNMRLSRQSEKAHRLSWIIANGPIPDGLHVLHSCDNPSCVNPGHLSLGINAENVADRERKGRNVNHVGERHGMSKLTKDIVREMRKKFASGEATLTQMASYYGVSKTTASRAVSGRSWSHVE